MAQPSQIAKQEVKRRLKKAIRKKVVALVGANLPVIGGTLVVGILMFIMVAAIGGSPSGEDDLNKYLEEISSITNKFNNKFEISLEPSWTMSLDMLEKDLIDEYDMFNNVLVTVDDMEIFLTNEDTQGIKEIEDLKIPIEDKYGAGAYESFLTGIEINSIDLFEDNKNIPGDLLIMWPVKNPIITSEWGADRGSGPHYGTDMVTVFPNVFAAADGKVIYASNSCNTPGYFGSRCPPSGGMDMEWGGNGVVIEHTQFGEETYYTTYAHNKRTTVKVGQVVTAGQKIAEFGNTGNSTGAHSHFELRKGINGLEGSIDPKPFMQKFLPPAKINEENTKKLKQSNIAKEYYDYANHIIDRLSTYKQDGTKEKFGVCARKQSDLEKYKKKENLEEEISDLSLQLNECDSYIIKKHKNWKNAYIFFKENNKI